ncbi:MAG: LysM peptidoglycan-binding domain-containing protein, partial [Phaeodactylibacter sp.]|nr:LysM peptidoglycan-binding domain-containing protein [Phaeodactylibacter sp.]
GYATSETYPNQLIGLIDRYNLHQYDLISPARDTSSLAFYPPLVTSTNDVPNTFASGFETAGDIAYRTRIPVERLLEYNENLVDGYVLPQGQKIYLAPKRNAFKGPVDFHQVAPGESVYDISQRYGVRVKKLLNRNRLDTNQEPEPGQSLKLSGRRVSAPPAFYPRADTGMPLPDTGISNPEPEPTPLPILFHTVEKGDTLWNIAQRYHTNVGQLMRLNNLDSNIIRIGELLRVQ